MELTEAFNSIYRMLFKYSYKLCFYVYFVMCIVQMRSVSLRNKRMYECMYVCTWRLNHMLRGSAALL